MINYFLEPDIVLIFILFILSIIILIFLYLNLKNSEQFSGTDISSEEIFSEINNESGANFQKLNQNLNELKNQLQELNIKVYALIEKEKENKLSGLSAEIMEVNKKLNSFIEPIKEDRALMVGIINEKVSVLIAKFEGFIDRLEKTIKTPDNIVTKVDFSELNPRLDELQNMLNIISENKNGDVIKEILEPGIKKILAQLEKVEKTLE